MSAARLRSGRWCAALALGAMLLGACSEADSPRTPASAATAATAADPAPESRLRALFDARWQQRLEDRPILATYLGDRRYNDRWDDLSAPAIAARKAADVEALRALDAIDRAALSPAAQLDYDLFRHGLQDRIAGHAFQPELMPLDQLDVVQLLAQIVEFTPFETVKDYEAWLARLQSFDVLVDQTIALMRRGITEKRLRPRIVMQRVPPQIAPQRVTRAQDSPFYAPFTRYPQSVGPEVRQQLDVAAQAAVLDTVVPALERLQTFLEREYIPACPENEMGLSAQPQGAAFYAWLVRHHTTTTLTPDQIHDIGLSEVARLRGEIAQVMRSAGHGGSAARFQEKLSWNPRYQYREPVALLDAYRAIAKRIDPELPRLFGRLPRTP
jgi:uncharacterized protein (DUF885 family)